MKIFIFFQLFPICSAMLFVQQNEMRSLDSLDGLWTFVLEPVNSDGIGLREHWERMDLSTFKNSTKVPVPAAYNDLSAERDFRDHVGWVWYQRNFIVPNYVLHQKLRHFLCFGSVNYFAVVFVNGEKVGTHEGGHLPFNFEVHLKSENTITVAVNNSLSYETIPQGSYKIEELPSKKGQIAHQDPKRSFDFFNYAGILRPVNVWHLPQTFIKDIKILADSKGRFSYFLHIDHGNKLFAIEPVLPIVTIYFNNSKIAELIGPKNSTKIKDPHLWWPRGMGEPNLYTAEAKLFYMDKDGKTLIDTYTETFGFRSVSTNLTGIYINNRQFYCHGFGMHEDFEVHGRGFDRAVMVKDLNMLEWLGANCYRTSHYPYSEERAYEADRRGIAVITEVPATDMKKYTKVALEKHKWMVSEMIARDKNHPSVIAWSLANEPKVKDVNPKVLYEYFSPIVKWTRGLDQSRPITIVFNNLNDFVKKLSIDILCANRYAGWYQVYGFTELINRTLRNDINGWKKFGKPIILSEYGAEAIPGFHSQPSVPFTEQYQVEVIKQNGLTLDELRRDHSKIAGELFWAFADFMTYEETGRPFGNHKGVLTRERSPKMGAYVIKERYDRILEEESEEGKQNHH